MIQSPGIQIGYVDYERACGQALAAYSSPLPATSRLGAIRRPDPLSVC